MSLITKVAYFVMCEQCTPQHGRIVCLDGTVVSCFSKRAARACVEELLRLKFIVDDEKKVLLEQIEDAPLVKESLLPAVFYPSTVVHSDMAFRPQGPVAVLNAAVDDKLVEELTGNNRADEERPTLH